MKKKIIDFAQMNRELLLENLLDYKAKLSQEFAYYQKLSNMELATLVRALYYNNDIQTKQVLPNLNDVNAAIVAESGGVDMENSLSGNPMHPTHISMRRDLAPSNL